MRRRWARPAALGLPMFRRYAASQMASSASLTCQRVAELWLVLEITGNALSLGVSTALRTAPSLLLAGAGGALADRFDRRALLAWTQGGKAVVGGGFAWLVAGGAPAIGTVYGLVLALGCLNAIDAPIRRAAVREVVGPEELAGAASLHTATISTARVIGGLLAGLLIAWFGIPAAFAFGAVASAAAAVGFRSLRFAGPGPGSETDPGPTDQSPAAARAGGLLARLWSPALRPAYLFLAVFSVIGWNIDVVIPLLADEVLGGGAVTYGVLVTCVSVGSFAGSVAAASWRSGRGEVGAGSAAEPSGGVADLTRSLLVFAAVLATVAATPAAVPVAASLTAAGFTGGFFLSRVNTEVQLGADRALQGRQVAVYTFVFIGSRALGAPLVGLVADWTGPRRAVVVMAAATFGLGLLVRAAFARRR